MSGEILQQMPHGSVEELQTFVCLQGRRRDVDQQSFQCRHKRRRRLVFQSRRTGRGRPEKWSYVSVDLRACPVSDRSTGSHMVPPLRL